jgi:crotonobetaine/carnitine-CoA ligase
VWDLYARPDLVDGGAPIQILSEQGATSYSRQELFGMAAGCAVSLAAAGVRAGDRVAVSGRNSAELIAALGGIARLGAISVPVNFALTGSELGFQLADSEPRVVIAAAEGAEKFEEALDGASWAPQLRSIDGDAPGWTPLDFSDPTAALPDLAARASEAAMILYTSGTSDKPKGVLLSHRSLCEEARRTVDAWALRPDDVVFGHFPFCHVGGIAALLFAPLSIGAGLATAARFSASRWSQEVRDCGASLLYLVGPQIRMLMAQPGSDSDADNRVRATCYGLAVPEQMEKAFCERFETPIFSCSGSTECLGSAYLEPVYSEHRWPALGRPAADREVALTDESGDEVAVGEPGELCVKGPRGGSVMMDYWNRPGSYQAAHRDGWYRTGDIGRMDEDGFIYFVDRKKDIIKCSGENVSAAEVERVLVEMDGIAEAAVVGRPDPIRDEVAVAFVVYEGDGDGPSEDEIVEHCRASLARFKVPGEIKVLDELPHTSLGKIEKKKLRQLVAEPA